MLANPFAAADADPPPSALGLRRRAAPVRVHTAADRADDSDGESPAARPLDRMSARGALLLLASVASFAAFALLALAELAPLVAPGLLRPDVGRDVHSSALWVLVVAAPATATAAWLPVSVASAGGQLRIRSPVSPSGSKSIAAMVVRSFRRNRMFAVYQGVAWTLYGVILLQLATCAVTEPSSSEAAEESASLWFCVPGGRSSLAVLAFIAEELVISSVLTLERRRDRNLRGPRDRFVVQLNNFNNMLLLVGAVALAASSEFARQLDHKPSAYPLNAGVGSLMLFVTALLNTYGLGGVLSTKDGWRFYQPFTGGARFVTFQIVSWTCFGAGLLIQGLYLVSLVMVELELFVGAMLAAGALFATSEVVMMMSLLVFRKSDANRPRGSFEQRLHNFADECLGVLVAGGLANIQYIPNALMFVYFALTTNLGLFGVAFYALTAFLVEFFMVISRSIATHLYNKDSRYGERTGINKYHVKYVLPRVITGIMPAIFTYHHYVNDLEPFYSVLVLTAATYIYEFTYRGNPQQSGSRMRPDWVTGKSVLIDRVKQYFSGQILTSGPPLDPNGQYIMAFHPHGIMPLSVMWLQFTDAWRQLFPNVYAHILTASVLHQIPLARDVLQYFGGREVTRQAFVATLQEKESVMLVPGGQAEMLQQQSGVKEIRVYTHHKGFIRLAIEHGVSLVPLLSFHESEIMDNVRAPAMQQWFVKKLGFPFPYIPYGRGLLPVPRKTDVTVAVGSPLAVEKVENPTQEVVDKVHAEYYSRVEALFHEHKKAAKCEDVKLVLI